MLQYLTSKNAFSEAVMLQKCGLLLYLDTGTICKTVYRLNSFRVIMN